MATKLNLLLTHADAEDGGTMQSEMALDAAVRLNMGDVNVCNTPGQTMQLFFRGCKVPVISLRLPVAGDGGTVARLAIDMPALEHAIVTRKRKRDGAEGHEASSVAAGGAGEKEKEGDGEEPPKKRARKPLTEEQKEARRAKQAAKKAAAAAATATADPVPEAEKPTEDPEAAPDMDE
jgi:hypothetical protein